MDSLVRSARVAAGLSMEEAARYLGIPSGYLSEIESGKRRVSPERAEQIAELYGVSREAIFLPCRYVCRMTHQTKVGEVKIECP